MEKIQFVGKCLVVESGEEKILVVGDLHVGYEEALERGGVFVGRMLFEGMMKDFEKIISHVGKVDCVVLLGDVKHEFGMISQQERKEIGLFFEFVKNYCGKVVLVQGNHDKIIAPLVVAQGIILKDYYISGEFCFAHGDKDFLEMHDKKMLCWVLGHGHPAIQLSDGVKEEMYKCFLVGEFEKKKIIIAPSFFSGNEGSDPRTSDFKMAWNFNFMKFRVFVVDEEGALDFGLLKNLERKNNR